MNAEIKNYRPVLGSLLSLLQKAGFDLHAVDNGGGWVALSGTDRQRRQVVKHEILTTQGAALYVEKGDDSLWLWVVLGDEPEDTVNDYSVDEDLAAVIDQHSKLWEGKPWPTK